MTPTQVISAKILMVIAETQCTAGEAIDAVLGKGTFAALIDDVYPELRKLGTSLKAAR